LQVGEGGAQRCDADRVAARGEGDGDRVQGSLDQHGDGSGGQRSGAFGQAVQLGAFAEHQAVGGVEVFRAGWAGAVVVVHGVGVAAADEPDDLQRDLPGRWAGGWVCRRCGGAGQALAGQGLAGQGLAGQGLAGQGLDGQDEPVAEPVDEPAGAGLGRQASLEQLGVGGAAGAQVLDQVGPAGGGVTGREPGVAGQVGAQALLEVLLRPRPAVGAGVETQGLRVELQQPLLGHRCSDHGARLALCLAAARRLPQLLLADRLVVGGGERRPVGRVRLGLPVLGQVLGRGLVELGWGGAARSGG